MRARTLTVTIERPSRQVYEFIANPENLPRWAAGLCRSVRRNATGEWIVETASGPMSIRFAAPNDLGVLDHHVSPAPGAEISVPMRVVPNGSGSELMFTLFQLPGMSEEKFAEDAALVERDLQTLKAVLEGGTTATGPPAGP